VATLMEAMPAGRVAKIGSEVVLEVSAGERAVEVHGTISAVEPSLDEPDDRMLDRVELVNVTGTFERWQIEMVLEP
jgi:hypothetical protein